MDLRAVTSPRSGWSILDLLCMRIVCEGDNADEGKDNVEPTETELLEAMKEWDGVGKKATTVFVWSRGEDGGPQGYRTMC